MQEVSSRPRNPFRDPRFLRTLLILAVPMIIQKLLLSSVNMLDSLMVGRLGDAEVAAVGIANQLYFVYVLFLEGISGGCSIFISQYWGANNRENIYKVMGLGFCAVCFIGILFTCVGLLSPTLVLSLFSREAPVLALGEDYLLIICWSYVITGLTFLLSSALRSIGNSRLPMLISFVALTVNAVFNLLLIFGLCGFPRMGVRGAALATVIARVVEFMLLSVIALKKNAPLRTSLGNYFSFGAPFALRVFRTALPVLLNDTLWGIGFTLYTVAYGLLGTSALASSQIARTVEQVFMVFSFSVAGSALVMVGNLVGAGDFERAKDYGRKLLITAATTGVLTGVCLFFTAPAVLTLYEVSTQVSSDAITLLSIYAFAMPFKVSASTLIVGLFRGGGDTSFAAKSELGALWLIGVPLVFVGAVIFKLPIAGLFLLQLSEDAVKLTLGLIHLRRGNWIRSVV